MKSNWNLHQRCWQEIMRYAQAILSVPPNR